MKRSIKIFIFLIMVLSSYAHAYAVIAVDQECNSFENGQLRSKISKGICRYEINPLLKSVSTKEYWVETFPDKVYHSKEDNYSVLAIDDPVPVSDIPGLRQKVIHAVSVGSMQVGTLKNSPPNFTHSGRNLF